MAAVEMLSESEQVRVIGNDHLILDNTTRAAEGKDVVLELAGMFFPDGKGVRWVVPELDRTVFMNWCNLVRGEWNERNQRKAAEETSASDARQAANREAAADAGVGGGGTSAVAPGVPSGEATVEEYLQAQVTRLAEQEEFQRNNIEDAERMITESRRRLAQIETEKQRALAALNIYKEGANAPGVCKEDRKELSRQTKSRRTKARSQMVRRADRASDQQG